MRQLPRQRPPLMPETVPLLLLRWPLRMALPASITLTVMALLRAVLPQVTGSPFRPPLMRQVPTTTQRAFGRLFLSRMQPFRLILFRGLLLTEQPKPVLLLSFAMTVLILNSR